MRVLVMFSREAGFCVEIGAFVRDLREWAVLKSRVTPDREPALHREPGQSCSFMLSKADSPLNSAVGMRFVSVSDGAVSEGDSLVNVRWSSNAGRLLRLSTVNERIGTLKARFAEALPQLVPLFADADGVVAELRPEGVFNKCDRLKRRDVDVSE
jgi:hypothetical protein